MIMTYQLAKGVKGQLECLGETPEKYITSLVPIKKKLDKNKTIMYKLKFIDSFRFISTSLSSLVDNLSEIYKKNVKDARKEEKSNQYLILLDLKIKN